jgi:hypothetical protein
MQFSRNALVAGLACAAAVAITACSDSGISGTRASTQLAFTTSAPASAALASVVPITNGGHTLDLTAVTLTISRAELKRARTDACAGDDDEGDDEHSGSSSSGKDGSCAEVKVGPTTVDLPLTGGMVTLPANTLPTGTFREFELRVSSVRLRGTFDNTPFDVTLAVNVKSEIEFSTPLEIVDGKATTITVNVPVNKWLVNADGSLVDPNKLQTNPTLLAQVKARIASSFRAFEDDDHDGQDDHDEHGGKGHG